MSTRASDTAQVDRDALRLERAGWRAEDVQEVASTILRVHRPDRSPLCWRRRWWVVPWPVRQTSVCLACQGPWPCPSAREADRLLSASRLLLSRCMLDDCVDREPDQPGTRRLPARGGPERRRARPGVSDKVELQ